MNRTSCLDKVFHKALDQIHSILTEGETLYIVGGAVRDLCLGRKVRELDVYLKLKEPELNPGQIESLPFKSVIISRHPMIYRAMLDERTWIDVQPGNEPIEKNLETRDFSINAMAVEWPFDDLEESLIDPFGGREDLKKRSIRAFRQSNILDDPLRMLRAYRLAAELQFDIDRETRNTIRQHAHALQHVARERIGFELLKLVDAPSSLENLVRSMEDGVLPVLIPELSATVGCQQGGYHHLDVWGHTLEVYRSLNEVIHWIDDLPCAPLFNEWFHHRIYSMEWPRRTFLYLAALLHDIGKPVVQKMKSPGLFIFHQHDVKGAEIAEKILQRLRISRRGTRLITRLIRFHLEPLRWMKQHEVQFVGKMLIRQYGDEALLLTLLSSADQLGKAGPLVEKDRHHRFRELTRWVVTQWFSHGAEPFPLSGRDIMSVFGFKPGPDVGAALKLARKAWEKGEWNDKDEGLAWLKARIHLWKRNVERYNE